MTQTPEPGEPGDDNAPPPPPQTEPPPPHGDPVAPPPGQGYQDSGYQQQGYQQQGYQPGYGGPGYPQGQPGAPYGIHPGTGIPYSDKQKLVAGLLNIFVAGVGRMYIGQVGLGVAQLLVTILTCGVGALWPIIDGILILTKDDARDAQGRILRS